MGSQFSVKTAKHKKTTEVTEEVAFCTFSLSSRLLDQLVESQNTPLGGSRSSRCCPRAPSTYCLCWTSASSSRYAPPTPAMKPTRLKKLLINFHFIVTAVAKGDLLTSYVFLLPVTQRHHGGGLGGLGSAELQRSDVAAELPEVLHTLLVPFHGWLVSL